MQNLISLRENSLTGFLALLSVSPKRVARKRNRRGFQQPAQVRQLPPCYRAAHDRRPSAPSLQELLRGGVQAAIRQKEPDQRNSIKGKAESSGLVEDQARPLLGIIRCKQGLPG